MGDAQAAADEVATIKSYAPKYRPGHAKRMLPYPDDKEFVRLVDGLAGAGMT